MNAIVSWLISQTLVTIRVFPVLFALRLLFDKMKTGKRILALLWMIAALALLCPLRIEMPLPGRLSEQACVAPAFSIVPEAESTGQTIAGVNGVQETGPAFQNGSFSLISLFFWIWLAGWILVLTVQIRSWILLKRRLSTAVPVRCGGGQTPFSGFQQARIYESDEVDSPFVFGLLRPRIYLPCSLRGANPDMVILHEQTHIRHMDPQKKAAAGFLSGVFWFNPLVWAGFYLFSRDLESICDERVIRFMNPEQKAEYSMALLKLSACPARPFSVLAAFGESPLKGRIRAILNYRRPGILRVLPALLACLLCGACSMIAPVRSENMAYIELPVGETEEVFWPGVKIRPESDRLTIDNTAPAQGCTLVLHPVDSQDGLSNLNVSLSKSKAALSVEKGVWYSIGILCGQDSEPPKSVSFKIGPVEIQSSGAQKVEIGDAPAVGNIVSGLPLWNEGIGYDHIELETYKKPYGLNVYIHLEGSSYQEKKAVFNESANLLFDSINNLSKIRFVDPLVSVNPLEYSRDDSVVEN